MPVRNHPPESRAETMTQVAKIRSFRGRLTSGEVMAQLGINWNRLQYLVKNFELQVKGVSRSVWTEHQIETMVAMRSEGLDWGTVGAEISKTPAQCKRKYFEQVGATITKPQRLALAAQGRAKVAARRIADGGSAVVISPAESARAQLAKQVALAKSEAKRPGTRLFRAKAEDLEIFSRKVGFPSR